MLCMFYIAYNYNVCWNCTYIGILHIPHVHLLYTCLISGHDSHVMLLYKFNKTLLLEISFYPHEKTSKVSYLITFVSIFSSLMSSGFKSVKLSLYLDILEIYSISSVRSDNDISVPAWEMISCFSNIWCFRWGCSQFNYTRSMLCYAGISLKLFHRIYNLKNIFCYSLLIFIPFPKRVLE